MNNPHMSEWDDQDVRALSAQLSELRSERRKRGHTCVGKTEKEWDREIGPCTMCDLADHEIDTWQASAEIERLLQTPITEKLSQSLERIVSSCLGILPDPRPSKFRRSTSVIKVEGFRPTGDLPAVLEVTFLPTRRTFHSRGMTISDFLRGLQKTWTVVTVMES